MNEIIIKTQAEWDALPQSFAEETLIKIKSSPDFWLIIDKARGSSHVEARGSSHVEARESSHVEARESSHVVAWESSHVVALGSSHVEAWESSHVEARGSSHVVAWGSSHVEARGSSHVEARESSHVEAWGSSHVVAWGSSHVEARESSHVEAWGSSHVVAWGSSHVVAWGSSHVEAWGSSHVVAWGSVSVSVQSTISIVDLFGFSVAILVALSKNVHKKSKTATIIKPVVEWTTKGWLEREGIKINKNKVILYKRVSKDFKTQEETKNETLWAVGTTLEHPTWKPETEECGEGKYHACSKGYFCDEFRSNDGDKYVAIEIAVKDLYAWKEASYPHKIAFRKGKVLYEVDKYGEKIS